MAGLRQIHFQQYNSPIMGLIDRPGADDLDLSPAYQRGSVWDLERRRNLIRSVLIGLPIGCVFLNRRSPMSPLSVVDGKQRIEALRAFTHGEFSIPSDWVENRLVKDLSRAYPPLAMYRWMDFTEVFHRFFWNSTIAQYQTTLPTEAEEKLLFDRINHGGIPHQ